MPRIQCFMLEPTGKVSIKLRRYSRSDSGNSCPLDPSKYSYHNVSAFFDNEPEELDAEGYIQNGMKSTPEHDDGRWPKQCACGYTFQERDEWQRSVDRIYRRTDTGEEMTISEAPVGAMWYAEWLDRLQVPQGKHNLMVRTPGGEWCIDSQSSNCGIPDDTKQEKHHCWIRHGKPPIITVDKSGQTCSAGAGSIQCGNYHGFLRNGYLED